MLYFIPYFLLFLVTCHALTLRPPKSTSSYGLHPQGWTPRPTQAPEYKLLRRSESVQTLIWADNNTCGYLSGIKSADLCC